MTRKHLLTLSLTLALASPIAADTWALSGVRVFDGDVMIEGATVVVTDGVILAVGTEIELPEGAEIVDGTGKTLLPGFIDSHTHAWGDALERAVIFGVTTELDMFGDPEFGAAQRLDQAEGKADHRADLFSAGYLATAPGGHGTQYGMDVPTLTETSQADGWVADRLAEGSNYIKIVLEDGTLFGRPLPTLDAELAAQLVAAAHSRHTLAVAHVTTFAQAQTALAARIDGLVHLFRDRPADDEFISNAVAQGLFVVPTLTVLESSAGIASGASLVDDPRFASWLTGPEILGLEGSFPGGSGAAIETAFETLRRLHAAGVPILAGSDAPNPGTAHGVSIHRELELMVAAGLDPIAALAAATSVPAATFSLDDRGRIAPGLRADLILIEGDPRDDITATRAIQAIWKSGRAIERPLQARPEPGGSLPLGLLADFENGQLSATLGAGWTPSTDSMMGGESVVELEVVDGGAGGSAKALAIAGELKAGFPFPWAGAMLFPGEAPMAPANLSDTAEIAFHAKGTPGTYRLMVFAQSLGQMPSQQTFEVDEEWRQIVVPVARFAGADFGGLTGLLWSAGPGAAAFELTIDDIELLGHGGTLDR